jgi:hypothetical protein
VDDTFWIAKGLLIMRLLLLVTAIAALAFPAAVGAAGDVHLSGPLEGGGSVTIDISDGFTADTAVRKYEWHFDGITVRCDGERRLARLPIDGGFAINAQFDGPGRWGIDGTRGEGPDGFYETRVAGRLINAGHARGWIRAFGTATPLAGGGHADCDSGRLRWSAER